MAEPPSASLFSPPACLAYILYLPLFLAGPIVTFNSYVSQLVRPVAHRPLATLLYGLRWLLAFLAIELTMHLFYVVAIKDNHAWAGFAPLDFAILAYLNLKIVWLKLLLIWRFFRFWALVDGIVPVENMARCMSNNYSGVAFWRSWHRSFNQWIIRYMYIPLGGTRTAAYSIWPIFTFVAIWHDIRLHLLAWSWLICLFMLPEIVCSWLSRRGNWPSLPYYRHLCALGGGANVFLMISANLVGFVVGIDGLKTILLSFATPRAIPFLATTTLFLFSGAHVLFEIRATERRSGVFHNY